MTAEVEKATKEVVAEFNIIKKTTTLMIDPRLLMISLKKLWRGFLRATLSLIILNKKEGGIHMSSSCYWDTTNDGNVLVKDDNDAVYIIANVFALYYMILPIILII